MWPFVSLKVGKLRHVSTQLPPSGGVAGKDSPAAATAVPIPLSPNTIRHWHAHGGGSPLLASCPCCPSSPRGCPCSPPLWLLLPWPRSRFNFSNSLERVLFHNSACSEALCLPALPSPTCCWRAPAAHACTCPARPVPASCTPKPHARLPSPPGTFNPGTPELCCGSSLCLFWRHCVWHVCPPRPAEPPPV